MPDDDSLSELCSICYTNISKYRCPRCNTRTCSLPCSSKHKQRASCSGVRDPAEYLKKGQLATPAGIDRDYNYLKGVEREIDVAHRDTRERGIGRTDNARLKASHPESILRKYLVANRIEVQKAPNGMSRQKTNQTRATKRHNVVWTVEWIDSEGRKEVSESCIESEKLVDLYSLVQSGSHVLKRKPKEDNSKSRRQRRKVAAAPHSSTTTESVVDVEDDKPVADPDAGATDVIASQTVTDAGKSHHFYLLRPGTTSSAKVLITLDNEATLTQCLQDRSVMEYPTIYVLPQSSEALPAGYILEEQYLKIRQREDDELATAVRQAEDDGSLTHAAKHQQTAAASSVIDTKSILDMLKRDVTR